MELFNSFAPYYFDLYWFMISILTLSQFVIILKTQGNNLINRYYDYRPVRFFVTLYVLIFGFRPISPYFGDTGVYGAKYKLLQSFSAFDLEGSNNVSSDYLFYFFQKLCALCVDVHFWLAAIMFFYMIMMFWGCRRIDYKHGALLMLFCCGAFEFYTYSVNGVRNGVACSFAIMAVACLCKEMKWSALLWSLVAIGCHKSTALPVAAMYFVYFVNKPKYMYISWMGAVVLSLTIGGYIDSLLSSISYDDRLATQLQGDSVDGLEMEHRFRWDFLLYSSMPLILGWYTIFKRKLYNKTYLVLLGTYIYSNVFWILAIRAMFSNRIAYLSWFIYPVVLAYPLLNFPVFKKHHSIKVAWILLAHFTLTTVLLKDYFVF